MPDGLLGAKLRRVPSPPLLQLRSHPGQRAAPASRRRHPAHSAGRESSCRNMLADRSHIAYSHFAPRAPHLYAVMFGPGLAEFRTGDPADLEAARSTFVSLPSHPRLRQRGPMESCQRHHRRRRCVVRCARPHHARTHRVLRRGRPRSSAFVHRDPYQNVDWTRRRRPIHHSLAVELETAGRPP